MTFFRKIPLPVFLAVLIVLLLAVWDVRVTLQETFTRWNVSSEPSWTGVEPGKQKNGEKVYDVDTHLIHGGLLKAPTFRDTGQWWTGTWVGQVPFYRPLTSMIFWAQWKTWGDQEQRYEIIALLCHLLAVITYACLAYRLFRFFDLPYPALGVLIMGWLFMGGADILKEQWAIIAETVKSWKNEPDSLTLLWFSLCCIAYIDDRERNRRTGWPLFWYLLICLTKEAGIFLPLLLPVLEKHRTALRKADWRSATPLFVAMPLYLILRTLFLHDAVGFRYGSNGAWLYRALHNFGGPIMEYMAVRRWYSFFATLFCLAFVGLLFGRLRTQRSMARLEKILWSSAGVLGVVGVMTGVLYFEQRIIDPAQAIVLLITSNVWWDIVSALFFTCALFTTFYKRPRLGIFLYGWALLSLGLTLFSPSVLHRYYLVNAGFALLIGAGCTFWIPTIHSLGKAFYQELTTPPARKEKTAQ